jgi:glycosyltransferase involved in cell wall biosynthesis
LESAAASTGIGERIRVPGTLSDADLHSLAAVADWFVHPTLYEGSSIATLEAMAHSLPVIASEAGGLPDKVRDGETGFLIPPGDVEALGHALVRAATTDGAGLGAAGRKLCESEFGWEVIVDRYIDLYQNVASLPRTAVPTGAPDQDH